MAFAFLVVSLYRATKVHVFTLSAPDEFAKQVREAAETRETLRGKWNENSYENECDRLVMHTLLDLVENCVARILIK